MGINYLIAGFVFFFLPNFSIIDLLPDFIGCLLILKGLTKLSDLTPVLSDAKRAFTSTLYLYIVKFALMFSAPYFGNTDGGYLLIFSFTFAVLDIIFVLPAFKTLLNGFLYLGDRNVSHSIFENQSEFSSLTTIFIIAKAVLAFIPDLAYISNPDVSGNVTFEDRGFYLSEYKNVLIALNLIVTVIIGTVWLVYAIRYFNNVKKDEALISALNKKYDQEIAPNEGLFIRRAVKNAFLMFSMGTAFMIDLSVDMINVLPDFFGMLLILIGLLTIKKYVDVKKITSYTYVCISVSLVAWSVLLYLGIKYPDVTLSVTPEAYKVFTILCAADAIKYIILAYFFVLYKKMIDSLLDNYTLSSKEELRSVSAMHEEEYIQNKSTNKTTMYLAILSCVSGIADTILTNIFPAYVALDFVITAVFAVYMIRMLNKIYGVIEFKYL